MKLVGTEVQTEDGVSLGKVRDYVFNPDTGAVSTIKVDALGLPSIPQALLACSSLGWEEVVAVGPTRVVVRRGADLRAVRENDSWVGDGISALLSILTGLQDEEEGGAAAAAALDADRYRADDAYLAWYAQYGRDYQQYYGMVSGGGIRGPPACRPASQGGGREREREKERERESWAFLGSVARLTGPRCPRARRSSPSRWCSPRSSSSRRGRRPARCRPRRALPTARRCGSRTACGRQSRPERGAAPRPLARSSGSSPRPSSHGSSSSSRSSSRRGVRLRARRRGAPWRPASRRGHSRPRPASPS